MEKFSRSQINNQNSQNFRSQNYNNYDRPRNSRPGYNQDFRRNYNSGPRTDFRNSRPRYCESCQINTHFSDQCRQAHLEEFINGKDFCKYCKMLNHRVDECHKARNARSSRFYREDSRLDRDNSRYTRENSGRVPNRPVNLINPQEPDMSQFAEN